MNEDELIGVAVMVMKMKVIRHLVPKY